jgi:hypothetical protein
MFYGFTVHCPFSNLCQSAFLYSEGHCMTTSLNSLFCFILKRLWIVSKGDTLLAVGRETVGEKHKTMMGMHVTSLRKGK